MPPKQKESTFGSCAIDRLSPPTVTDSTRVVNLVLSFEDALKLNLAISEGVHTLNRHNRATREGRDAALVLTVYLDKMRINVTQDRVKRASNSPA